MPRKKTIDAAACHRLHMLVPPSLYDDLAWIAKVHGTNHSDMIRKLITAEAKRQRRKEAANA